MGQPSRNSLSFRGLAVALGMLVLLATACSSAILPTFPSNLAKNQVFHYGMPTLGSGDIATLDPNLVGDVYSATVVLLTFDGLVTLDKDAKVEQWAAKGIDISGDGLRYTFHLRDGLAFSDGTPITANNFAYSIDRALNPCLASPVAYYLFTIKDAQAYAGQTCANGTIANASGPAINTLVGDSLIAPDDSTLVIKLAQPAAYFLEAMTYPTSYAVEPSVIGPDITSERWLDTLAQGPTGRGTSGMFAVRSWDHAAGRLVLKQNPHWWGLSQGKKPYLTEIDFSFLKDADTAYAAYQAGQFDVGSPTAQLVEQARGQPDFHSEGTLTFYGLIFNWNSPPFNNLDARKALCLAINRDALSASVLKHTDAVHWNIVPKGMPGYNPNVTGPDGVSSTAGDAAKAAAHWAAYKATLNGGAVPALTFTYDVGSGTVRQLVQALQGQWQQVLGVRVALKGESLNAVERDPGVTLRLLGWADDYPDPQDFLTVLFSTGSPLNLARASVPEADQLLARADKDTNQARRIQLYNQAEQLLIDNVAACPLSQGILNYQVREYVHNWSLDASTFAPLDSWAATYIASH